MTTAKTKVTSPEKHAKSRAANFGDSGKPYQWKPGQSGNPGGRPPGILYISDRLRELLARDAGNGKTNADLVAEVILGGILDPSGNLKHGINTALVKELLDRMEGKVPETHKIEGDIPVSIVYRLKESEGKE